MFSLVNEIVHQPIGDPHMKNTGMIIFLAVALAFTVVSLADEQRTQLMLSKLTSEYQLDTSQTQLLQQVVQSGRSLKASINPKNRFRSLVLQKIEQDVIQPEILIEDYRLWSKEFEKQLSLTLIPLTKLHSSLTPKQRKMLMKDLEEASHD